MLAQLCRSEQLKQPLPCMYMLKLSWFSSALPAEQAVAPFLFSCEHTVQASLVFPIESTHLQVHDIQLQ